MSVTKNVKTGKWDCQIWYKDWQGKRTHTTKRGFDRKRDAEEYERKFLAKKQNQDITMEKAAEEFIAYMNHKNELGDLKESSLDDKTRIIKKYILPYFQNVKITSITANDVTKWLAYLNTHSKLRKRLGSRTLNKYRSQLNQIFEFCKRNYNIDSNPVTLTERAKFFTNDKRAKYWTVEDFNTCYAIIDEPIYKLLFTVIYWSGLRIGEALALTPSDILPDKIHVKKNMLELRNKPNRIDTPKNENSSRDVIIPNYLYMQIRHFLDGQYGIKEDDLIFDGITQHKAYNKLQKYIKRANLPHISSHIMRHSYASNLYSSSHDITIVASQIGHADINTTFKFYAHMLPEKDKQAISTLERELILAQNEEKKQTETHLELTQEK